MTARLLADYPDRSPEWMDLRRTRVGGSDIGPILGWGTPGWNGKPIKDRADVIAEKLSTEPPKKTAAKSRGVYCEPAIAAWLADREDIQYDPERSHGTWVDVADERMMVNPDAVSTDGAYCEFKTTDFRDVDHGWGRAGTDQVPLAYACQCQWAMGILGLDRAFLAVLYGQPKLDFARYKLRFDPDVYQYLREQASIFLDELANHQANQTRTAA